MIFSALIVLLCTRLERFHASVNLLSVLNKLLLLFIIIKIPQMYKCSNVVQMSYITKYDINGIIL